MPGLGTLDDAAFIRAFQVIDRVIQNNQPLFMFVWVGSVLSLLAAVVVGVSALGGAERLLLGSAASIYLVCVQLPTAFINVPLNNALKTVEPSAMSETLRQRARRDFEPRWNQWNVIRTACASVTSILLLLLLFRL
jgi:uncharacterized membrane protein